MDAIAHRVVRIEDGGFNKAAKELLEGAEDARILLNHEEDVNHIDRVP